MFSQARNIIATHTSTNWLDIIPNNFCTVWQEWSRNFKPRNIKKLMYEITFARKIEYIIQKYHILATLTTAVSSNDELSHLRQLSALLNTTYCRCKYLRLHFVVRSHYRRTAHIHCKRYFTEISTTTAITQA